MGGQAGCFLADDGQASRQAAQGADPGLAPRTVEWDRVDGWAETAEALKQKFERVAVALAAQQGVNANAGISMAKVGRQAVAVAEAFVDVMISAYGPALAATAMEAARAKAFTVDFHAQQAAKRKRP